MRKKILLVNPAKVDNFRVNRLHMGLALLAGILSKAGHEALVLDYAFLRGLRGILEPPRLAEVIGDFQPDVVGLSVFSYQYDECRATLEQVRGATEAPVIVGGPHLAIFPEDFAQDKRVSYIVRGEAEKIIVGLVEAARRESIPVQVDAELPAAADIPAQNLDSCYGNGHLECYQIQLSRGCPFSCSFCNIEIVAGRLVRAREIETCLQELEVVLKRFPSINTITVTDDCPNFNKERFKGFLRLFAKRLPGLTLTVDNVRADLLDEEMVELYAKAGGKNLCLGTESGHPDVFNQIGKGATLDRVVEAAGMIRRAKLQLGLCFVIGLPGDSPERHLKSIELAKRLKPDYVFWNMCVPWPGTAIHEWFLKHGSVSDVRNFSTLIDSWLNFNEPCAWTDEFDREERVRAWFTANLDTFALPILTRGNLVHLPRLLVKLVAIGLAHGLVRSVVRYLAGFVFFKMGSLFRTKLMRRLAVR